MDTIVGLERHHRLAAEKTECCFRRSATSTVRTRDVMEVPAYIVNSRDVDGKSDVIESPESCNRKVSEGELLDGSARQRTPAITTG